MLDPIQARVLEQARTRKVRVSGFPGSGKSALARAIAEDAAARGLSCLLVGDSPVLDAPAPPLVAKAPLHPTLARRAAGPPPQAAPPARAGIPDDPAALRAALDPDAVRLAGRLREMARELLDRHGLDADAIETTAAGGATDPALVASLRLMAADARLVAEAAWEGPADARTLSEVADLVSGRRPPPNAGHGALVLDSSPDAVDDYLARLAALGEGRAGAHVPDGLWAALDPWAWRPGLASVADAHGWASRTGALLAQAADLVDRHGDLDAALSDPAADPGATAALRVMRSRFPDVGVSLAVETCRAAAASHRQQAEGVEPYLAAHAGRPLATVRDLTGRAPEPGIGRLAGRLRAARHAVRRLENALGATPSRMQTAAWEALLPLSLSELSVLDALPDPGGERRDAARTLRDIRDAYAATGFGDLFDPGPLPESVPLPPALRPARGPSPALLDLLLPAPRARPSPGGNAGGVRRLREGDDVSALAHEYDVVVVDDEATLSDTLFGAVTDLSSMTHYIGVRPGDDDGHALGVPHRQRDALLANVAAGLEGRPRWLGSPRGAGVIVRRLPEDRVPDLGRARDELVRALVSAGYGAAGHEAGPGRHDPSDIVVVSAESADEAVVRHACGLARDGVVVLCRDSSWEPPVMRRAGVDGLPDGWNPIVSAEEGDIYVRAGKSALVVREPSWADPSPYGVADRVERLRALGWNPVVEWEGSPRPPGETSRLLSASAVAPDPRMILVMRGHDLDQAPRPIAAPGG